MKASLRFLGSGGSMGVPVIGCNCAVCRSKDPLNKRLRPSALLTVGERKILIDCGPDVRQQLLRDDIQSLDGIILTHAHYDHVEGIDDIRAFSIKTGKATPILMSQETLGDLKVRFKYIFDHQKSDVVLTTRMAVEVFKGKRGSIDFCGIPITYFTFVQMGMEIQGLRFGNLAYVSDIKIFPDTVYQDLKGVDTLIISALRHTESKMHFTVNEAVAFSKASGAKKTWLTHISHELDHEETNRILPENVRMSYDGLQIEFEL